MSGGGVGSSGSDAVRLEISAAVVSRLLAQGHLRAADLRSLDCESLHCLCRSCLKSCVWPAAGCVAVDGRCLRTDEDAKGGRPS
jgi:hypothetical protein